MATTSAPGYLAFFTKEVKSVVHNLVKISLTLLKVTSVLEEIILFIIVFAISILSAVKLFCYSRNIIFKKCTNYRLGKKVLVAECNGICEEGKTVTAVIKTRTMEGRI
jgi:hypothetical protein